MSRQASSRAEIIHTSPTWRSGGSDSYAHRTATAWKSSYGFPASRSITFLSPSEEAFQAPASSGGIRSLAWPGRAHIGTWTPGANASLRRKAERLRRARVAISLADSWLNSIALRACSAASRLIRGKEKSPPAPTRPRGTKTRCPFRAALAMASNGSKRGTKMSGARD